MLSAKPCIVVIGMNTRSAIGRRAEEEMANAGAHDNQVPPLEEVAMGDQVSVVLLPMTDWEIRSYFLNFS